MRVYLLLALLVLVSVACGCEAIKNDRILGDNPWQPSGFANVSDK